MYVTLGFSYVEKESCFMNRNILNGISIRSAFSRFSFFIEYGFRNTSLDYTLKAKDSAERKQQNTASQLNLLHTVLNFIEASHKYDKNFRKMYLTMLWIIFFPPFYFKLSVVITD
jgi:hypothetical protein